MRLFYSQGIWEEKYHSDQTVSRNQERQHERYFILYSVLGELRKNVNYIRSLLTKLEPVYFDNQIKFMYTYIHSDGTVLVCLV